MDRRSPNKHNIMKLSGTLIGHRWGRIALPVRCCLRNGKVAWHWQGVCREWRAAASGRRDRLATRHAVWLMAVLVALPCAASPAAYLVSVGPAPLRFQASVDAKPRTSSSPLPREAPVTDSCIPEAMAATNVTTISQSPPAQACPSAGLSTNEVAITPQMVVEFFRSHAGANGNRDTAVVVPYNFTPPTPSGKPSSSATYEAP